MDVYIDVNVELSREFLLKNNELYFGTYTLLRIQKMKKNGTSKIPTGEKRLKGNAIIGFSAAFGRIVGRRKQNLARK